MTARNTFLQGMAVLCFALSTVAFLILECASLTVQPTFAQDVVMKGYCASDAGQTVVYISEVFNTGLRKYGFHDDQPIDNEFNEYLKGRFDFKGNETYPVGCPLFDSVSQAEASRREFENQTRQANKQVVEVNWGFKPNEVEIALSAVPRTEHEANGPPRPRPTHTWCLSDTNQGTIYSTGPFDTDQNWAQWYQGFNRFLKEKYSFPGRVECKVTTLSDARRLIQARTDGARAAGRKVLDTGWRYDPSTAVVSKPAPKDDDPEPAAQRRVAPSPSQDVRAAATKEIPDSQAYCQKDPAMSAFFNCQYFSRSVYGYRIAHPGDAQSIASLVAGEKLNLSECIDNMRVMFWVKDRAAAQKLSPQVTNCAVQNVISTLNKKPQLSHMQEFYKEAVAACSK
jgi:hypothetical protein